MGEIRLSPGYDMRELTEGACGPAVWAGAGAEAMGLTGTADRDALTRVFSGEDPVTDSGAAC